MKMLVITPILALAGFIAAAKYAESRYKRNRSDYENSQQLQQNAQYVFHSVMARDRRADSMLKHHAITR